MEIAGEIRRPTQPVQAKELEALPSVIIQAGLEHSQGEKTVDNKESNLDISLHKEDEGSLQDMLESIDAELRSAKTQVRSYQEMALKHQSNPAILSNLDRESKFYQDKYDNLIQKRDTVVKRLRVLRAQA